MRDITYEIRSNKLVDRLRLGSGPGMPLETVSEWNFTLTSNAAIRKSSGFKITSFRDLVTLTAQLAVANPRLFPLFRGQVNDYTNRVGASKLYPSIFRPPTGQSRLSKVRIKDRFKYLHQCVELLRSKLPIPLWQAHLSKHREYWWTLLQHYDLAATPLLDMTQSLRVAATFALHSQVRPWGEGESGYLYVFGLPHAPACLSPMVDEEMVMIRLQSVCPPEALRPHYQEGYLVGRWPLSTQKLKGDNAAYRLIGKFHLENVAGSFWNEDFRPIPERAVYPDSDPFAMTLSDVLKPLLQTRPR